MPIRAQVGQSGHRWAILSSPTGLRCTAGPFQKAQQGHPLLHIGYGYISPYVSCCPRRNQVVTKAQRAWLWGHVKRHKGQYGGGVRPAMYLLAGGRGGGPKGSGWRWEGSRGDWGGGFAVYLTNKAQAIASSFSIADLSCHFSIILRQLLHELSC